MSLADLQNDEVAFRKFKLITEDVQGKNCLTNFHGMDLTRDKMCSMVKKWQVMIIFLLYQVADSCTLAHVPVEMWNRTELHVVLASTFKFGYAQNLHCNVRKL